VKRKGKNLPAIINERERELELQNLRLVATIRNMDQDIYRLSQCLDFIAMRPILQKLTSETQARMADESDRIRRLLVPEIQRTYNQHAAALPKPTKRITKR